MRAWDRWIAALPGLAALAILGGLAGCGGEEEKPSGTVTGTVTFEGEPVTSGEVRLLSPESGFGASATLGEGGKFTFTTPIEVGTYRVMVTPPPLEEAGDPMEVEVAQPQNIPQGYQSETTSDLTAEITEGDNTITVEMKRGGPAGPDPNQVAP